MDQQVLPYGANTTDGIPQADTPTPTPISADQRVGADHDEEPAEPHIWRSVN
ncbi:hypothetical protein [Streptomyces lincolnensis]|uniref:hypothetical protein n=1 Tax=Streptomyces lincolnensis TaxID=1915 RepID=UPI0037D72D5D